jgi:hypothetical protein
MNLAGIVELFQKYVDRQKVLVLFIELVIKAYNLMNATLNYSLGILKCIF